MTLPSCGTPRRHCSLARSSTETSFTSLAIALTCFSLSLDPRDLAHHSSDLVAVEDGYRRNAVNAPHEVVGCPHVAQYLLVLPTTLKSWHTLVSTPESLLWFSLLNNNPPRLQQDRLHRLGVVEPG